MLQEREEYNQVNRSFVDSDSEDENSQKDSFRLRFLENVGQGSFGKIKKAVDLVDNQFCAVKILNKSNNQSKYQEIELSILNKLNHPHIIKFKRTCESRKHLYIVMEYLPGGNLKEFIGSRRTLGKPFAEEEVARMMKIILEAVNCMHERHVLHRDLKPDNILLSRKDDSSSLKVADFGLSTSYSDYISFQSYNKRCGTLLYMAPEALSGQEYSKPVDIWACGIIMYMLFSMGKHPFYNDAHESQKQFVSRVLEQKWVFPANFSTLAIDLLRKLTQQDPSIRYNAGQALHHPFITRKLQEQIPHTFDERLRIFEKQKCLENVFRAVLFLQFLKKKCPCNKVAHRRVENEANASLNYCSNQESQSEDSLKQSDIPFADSIDESSYLPQKSSGVSEQNEISNSNEFIALPIFRHSGRARGLQQAGIFADKSPAAKAMQRALSKNKQSEQRMSTTPDESTFTSGSAQPTQKQFSIKKRQLPYKQKSISNLREVESSTFSAISTLGSYSSTATALQLFQNLAHSPQQNQSPKQIFLKETTPANKQPLITPKKPPLKDSNGRSPRFLQLRKSPQQQKNNQDANAMSDPQQSNKKVKKRQDSPFNSQALHCAESVACNFTDAFKKQLVPPAAVIKLEEILNETPTLTPRAPEARKNIVTKHNSLDNRVNSIQQQSSTQFRNSQQNFDTQSTVLTASSSSVLLLQSNLPDKHIKFPLPKAAPVSTSAMTPVHSSSGVVAAGALRFPGMSTSCKSSDFMHTKALTSSLPQYQTQNLKNNNIQSREPVLAYSRHRQLENKTSERENVFAQEQVTAYGKTFNTRRIASLDSIFPPQENKAQPSTQFGQNLGSFQSLQQRQIGHKFILRTPQKNQEKTASALQLPPLNLRKIPFAVVPSLGEIPVLQESPKQQLPFPYRPQPQE